jgi:hypothetical protein
MKNEVKTNQEVIMKEAKTGKESITSKANYLSNRQTFIWGGGGSMKGILTFLIAFVVFGFSSCKKSPRENESPVPVKEANDSSTTSSSASPVVPPPPVSPPPPSAPASNSDKKVVGKVEDKVKGKVEVKGDGKKGEGKEIGKSKNINTSTANLSATNFLPLSQQHGISQPPPEFKRTISPDRNYQNYSNENSDENKNKRSTTVEACPLNNTQLNNAQCNYKNENIRSTTVDAYPLRNYEDF